MISYTDLRALHIFFASVSLAGFALRGGLMLFDSPMLQRRWLRIAPHLNDSLLLTAAIGLAVMSGQYPWATPWLAAKIIGLLIYIGLGLVALRPGHSKQLRVAAWIAAMLCFVWIASVARMRNPFGFFALL